MNLEEKERYERFIAEHKHEWGPGPWQDEPDRVEWRSPGGLACLVLRNRSGVWCGYVGVPPGHPLHGVDYNQEVPELAFLLEKRKREPIREEDVGMGLLLAAMSGDVTPSPEIVLRCHGGVTYSGGCRGSICHVPEKGEPDDVWWFGFDCCHAFDYSPNSAKFRRDYLDRGGDPSSRLFLRDHEEYRDLAYASGEVDDLAAQLEAIGRLH